MGIRWSGWDEKGARWTRREEILGVDEGRWRKLGKENRKERYVDRRENVQVAVGR